MPITRIATMAAAIGTSGNGNTTGADFVAWANAKDGSSAPTDSLGNSLTSLTKREASAGVSGVQLFYKASPTVGASHNASTTGGYPATGGVAYGGVNTSSAFDQEVGSGGNTASPRSSGSLTPSEANCLLLFAGGFYGAFSGGTYPVSSPFSTVTELNVSGSNVGLAISEEIQSGGPTARNPDYSWSAGFGNHTGVSLACFKAAGAAAAVLPDRRFPRGICRGILRGAA